jgi:hypothetical protein
MQKRGGRARNRVLHRARLEHPQLLRVAGPSADEFGKFAEAILGCSELGLERGQFGLDRSRCRGSGWRLALRAFVLGRLAEVEEGSERPGEHAEDGDAGEHDHDPGEPSGGRVGHDVAVADRCQRDDPHQSESPTVANSELVLCSA